VANLMFTVSPIAVSAIEFVTPLGGLNPPGHTLPTDHIYFYHRLYNPGAPAYEVVAPAGGTVTALIQHGDSKVYVAVTATETYYLDHVILDPNIRQGVTVTAGQRLGVTSTASYGIDLGLVNTAVTQGFIVPARYSNDSLHADAPLKYFEEPLRATLYGLVTRSGADKDGRIDFDQPGRLSGNWFLDSLPISESSVLAAGTMQLAFVRDSREPDERRICIGGTLSMAGIYGVAPDDPDPADVSAASGRVEYHLIPQGISDPGILLVQVIGADAIRVETFPGGTPGSVAFTSAVRTYRR